MDSREVSVLFHIDAEARIQFLSNFIRIPFQLLRTVLGELRYRWLRCVPEALAILIQVGSSGSEPSQSIAEDCGCFPRHYTPEFDTTVFQTTMCSSLHGRRAEVDRAGNSSGRVELAQVGHLAVDLKGQRARPIDVLFDDRLPVVR